MVTNTTDPIDIWSQAYVFNRKYECKRNAQEIWQVTANRFLRRSKLLKMLREGLTEERRGILFPDDFDLGNGRSVPKDLCSMGKLAKYIGKKEGREEDFDTDYFRTIQNGILSITGRSISEHLETDASATLKVMHTLYRMMKQRNPSLMRLLSFPEANKRFSLSLREGVPFVKDQEHVWQLSDLKSYLCTELSDETFWEITSLYARLDDFTVQIVSDVDRHLQSIGVFDLEYDKIVAAYDNLQAAVQAYEAEQKVTKAVPLDEELFVRLHTLEYAHFVSGYPQIIKAATDNVEVRCIRNELESFVRVAFPAVYICSKIDSKRIQLRNVSTFAKEQRKFLIPLIVKALGDSVTDTDFDHACEPAQSLLHQYYAFTKVSLDALTQELKISPWMVVTALCCVLITQRDKTKFPPYWLGQKRPGDSVMASMKKPLGDISASKDDIPEEHRLLWSFRLEWISNLLIGQAALRSMKFKFCSALLEMVLKICNTNDPTQTGRELLAFDAYIERNVGACAVSLESTTTSS